MTLAFKEWSLIVDALGKGLQSIILRKGGIDEEQGEFSIKGKRFLLFPTLFHQAKDLIKPEWISFLEEHTFHTTPDTVTIRYYAEIVHQKVITDWEVLKRLYGQHAWSEQIISERFNRWNKSVHLLLLQVYTLEHPLQLPLLPQYDGCKSWIEIENDITFGGKPVINQKIKGTYF